MLCETATHAVFVDPLADPADAALWSWADERCAGREVVVLQTIRFHRRSADAFIGRYRAATAPPDGIVALPVPLAEETLYFVPAQRALIPGDVLITDGAGELSLCPASWLEELDPPAPLADVRAALRALLALDPELVLVSHGEPVLAGGRAALERALERP